MTRDPRVDPRPGDVLSKRDGRDREVDEVYDDCVMQPCPRNRRVVYTGDWCCYPEVDIRTWRRWAATAEVIFVAGEGRRTA